MKKLMLSAAVATMAFAVTPAMAQDESGVKLSLGGHFAGYVNYTNQDDGDVLIAGDQEVHSLDILRNTEVHFGGETALDNGLTVGALIEADTDAGDDFSVDESYAYFSGEWGRVNVGSEDGAAYLLQVAAPSADENIDGIRQEINPLTGFDPLEYDNDGFEGTSGNSDKITYLTPVFSGFQAGLSYTPEANTASRGNAGNSTENDASQLEDIYEVAVRYEGEMSGVGFAAGAGYTNGSAEVGSDDFKEWNVGVDANFDEFGLGFVYTENNNFSDVDDKNETWVVGADYTTGPYKIGASYLNNTEDARLAGTEVETDRYAVGAQYSYGPGMSFRGTVSHAELDSTVIDNDGTAVTVGTTVGF